MSNNEWNLVENAKEGDVHAFARLYEKLYKELYRFALCFLKNTEMAEDAVSAAVLKAYENLRKLRKNDSFKSWLFQITANECRQLLRKQESYLEDTEWEEPHSSESGFEMPELKEMFSVLSDDERLVVALSVFGGYTSREIAHMIQKREGSVRSLKSRALSKLKKYIGE